MEEDLPVYTIPEQYPSGPALASLMAGWLKFLLHTRNVVPEPLDILRTQLTAEEPSHITGIQRRRSTLQPPTLRAGL